MKSEKNTLDHVGNRLACKVKEWLDVEVVCGLQQKKKKQHHLSAQTHQFAQSYKDQLKESALVDLAELEVPVGDVVCPSLLVLILGGRGVLAIE